ncbi:MAG: prepilin-type N-terminal cleavage/methylation domain-containing protein [Thermoanaerobaculia bacterium]
MIRRRGFSVIELLIAVGIIAMIAAIAMGNYFNAIHRSKQKRTMADMRSVAVAWESRAVDTKQYNAAGGAFSMPAGAVSYQEMVTMLSPTYIRTLPSMDGWGFPMQFRADQTIASATAASSYGLRSPGRDGIYSGTYNDGPTTNYDCDIVYSGGQFIVYPEGVQQK